MAQVLLSNITDREKLLKIKLTLFKLGVACREVAPEEYAHPLGYLLGRAGYAPAAEEAAAERFAAEMVLMDGLQGPLFNRFLDSLRAERATVALKAVATEHNVSWSSARLHRELEQEHLAMSRIKGSHRANKSKHRKKK